MKPGTIFTFAVAFSLGVVITRFWHPAQEHQTVNDAPSTGTITVMEVPSPPVQVQLEEPRQLIEGDAAHEPEAAPTQQQQELYDQILTNLLNPSFVLGVTMDEVRKETEGLTPQQRKQLLVSAQEMVANGELDLNGFKKSEMQRYLTIAEGAPLPTLEEQARFYQVLSRLEDPIYKENMTFASLAIEMQLLPPALKQEVADVTMAMIENGDIDSGRFLGDRYAGRRDIQLFFR